MAPVMTPPGARPLRSLRLAFVLSMVAGVLVVGTPARACSCAEVDLSVRLPEADGAFVGTFVGRDPLDEQTVAITFSVERVVKGDFGPSAIVRTSAFGASCGIELLDGPRTGLLLDRAADGVWESGLCQQVAPGALLAMGGDRPPDPGVSPVSAGWSTAFKGIVGGLVAVTVVLLVIVWVVRRRASQPRESDVA